MNGDMVEGREERRGAEGHGEEGETTMKKRLGVSEVSGRERQTERKKGKQRRGKDRERQRRGFQEGEGIKEEVRAGPSVCV